LKEKELTKSSSWEKLKCEEKNGGAKEGEIVVSLRGTSSRRKKNRTHNEEEREEVESHQLDKRERERERLERSKGEEKRWW
jgi:hypothetical protein